MTERASTRPVGFDPPRAGNGRYTDYKSSAPEGVLTLPRAGGDGSEEVVALVDRAVRRRAASYGLTKEDVEDVRQNALIAVLNEQKRRQGINPDAGQLTVEDDGKLIRHITRVTMSHGIDPNIHQRDRRAYGVYRQELEKLRAGGVKVSSKMQDDIAERVRMSFAPGDRPQEGFHSYERALSLNAPVGEDGAEFGDAIAAPADLDSGFATDDSAAARLLSARMTGEVDAAAAKRGAWDAIAQTREAPMAAEGALTTTAAAKARAHVTEHGGAMEAMRSWLAGELDVHGEAAVFAPFGTDLDNKQMERVCQVFLDHPDYAGQLWDSAMAVATHRSGANRL